MPLTQEDFKKNLAQIRATYSEASKFNNFSALVMGEPNSGKTSLLKTCRKPILVDCFDPLGDLTLRKKSIDDPSWASIDDGSIFVRRWIKEKSKEPTQYNKWDEVFQKDIQSGFLSNLGTYCLDSATTLINALTNRLVKTRYQASLGKPKQLSPDNLDMGGYIPLYNTMQDIVKMASSQGCDFIMTVHLIEDKRFDDEGNLLGSSMEYYVYKGLKVLLPTLFAERYAMKPTATAKGVEFKLLTRPQGIFKHPGSKLGGAGILEVEEKADIKHILKKLGLSTEDKPF